MGHANADAYNAGITMSLIKYFEIISDKEWEEKYHKRVKIAPKKYATKTRPMLQELFTKLNGGNYNDTVVFDLETKQKQKINDYDETFIEVLKDLGYKLTKETYMAGKAINEKGKEVNIADIVNGFNSKIKTKRQMKEVFEKTKNPAIEKQLEAIDDLEGNGLIFQEKIDTNKLMIYNANQKGKYKIVFTMNIKAIASQSTKVGWESCMNLNHGINKSYVGPGISEGMFIAYLTKAGDEYTLDNPTARVLLKPLKSNTGEIVWDVDQVYGTAPKEFESQVRKIIKPFSSKKIGKYELPKEVYHDAGKRVKFVGGLRAMDPHELIAYVRENNVSIDQLRPLLHKTKDQELMETILRKHGSLIRELENPSEELKIAAVESDGHMIQHIDKPSLAVQMAAVKDSGTAIRWIKNPDIKVQMAAVEQDGMALGYIKDPDNRVANAAIKDDGEAIKYIKYPTIQQQKLALDGPGGYWGHGKYIHNIDDEVIIWAIREGHADDILEHINQNTLSDEILMMALKTDEDVYQYIKHPTDEMKWYITKNYPMVFIDQVDSRTHAPTEEMKAYIRKHDRETYEWIF